MKYLILLLSAVCLAALPITAQTRLTKPCTDTACGQFDFWIGEWDLTYHDTVHATNRINKEMGGCLIHEHFNDPFNTCIGESWSVYNPQMKEWQQTWVDNKGNYFTLAGEYKNGKMVLTTGPFTQNGIAMENRMVYANITHHTFDWSWQNSTDNGKTWTNKWTIHYTRKGKYIYSQKK